MILKLDMKDRGEEFYNVYINHDPDLFYCKVNMEKSVKMSFEGQSLQEIVMYNS